MRLQDERRRAHVRRSFREILSSTALCRKRPWADPPLHPATLSRPRGPRTLLVRASARFGRNAPLLRRGLHGPLAARGPRRLQLTPHGRSRPAQSGRSPHRASHHAARHWSCKTVFSITCLSFGFAARSGSSIGASGREGAGSPASRARLIASRAGTRRRRAGEESGNWSAAVARTFRRASRG